MVKYSERAFFLRHPQFWLQRLDMMLFFFFSFAWTASTWRLKVRVLSRRTPKHFGFSLKGIGLFPKKIDGFYFDSAEQFEKNVASLLVTLNFILFVILLLVSRGAYKWSLSISFSVSNIASIVLVQYHHKIHDTVDCYTVDRKLSITGLFRCL